MDTSAIDEKWKLLLSELDERLQLGLLDRLSRVTTYSVEEDTLILRTSLSDDYSYLTKNLVIQQLTVLSQEFFPIEHVKILFDSAN